MFFENDTESCCTLNRDSMATNYLRSEGDGEKPTSGSNVDDDALNLFFGDVIL